MTKTNLLWQAQRLVIYGKGGPYGKQSKRRVIPLTPRVFQLLSYTFRHDNQMPFTKRTAQRIVKRVANRASMAQPVTSHVLRHYADTQTMPRQGVVRDCKSSLCNELFHFLTYVHAA